jgi:hypothetical protein
MDRKLVVTSKGRLVKATSPKLLTTLEAAVVFVFMKLDRWVSASEFPLHREALLPRPDGVIEGNGTSVEIFNRGQDLFSLKAAIESTARGNSWDYRAHRFIRDNGQSVVMSYCCNSNHIDDIKDLQVIAKHHSHQKIYDDGTLTIKLNGISDFLRHLSNDGQ